MARWVHCASARALTQPSPSLNGSLAVRTFLSALGVGPGATRIGRSSSAPLGWPYSSSHDPASRYSPRIVHQLRPRKATDGPLGSAIDTFGKRPCAGAL
jgi:hypothetical protein